MLRGEAWHLIVLTAISLATRKATVLISLSSVLRLVTAVGIQAI